MPITRIEELLAGVTRFETDVFPGQREHFEDLAHGQQPAALFITCSDSRVLPNLITQTRPGELFLCRDIGNIVPAHGAVYGGVSATIEYSVSVLRVPHVIICGHSDCGAIRCLLEPERLEGLSSVTQWLSHAEAAYRIVTDRHPGAPLSVLLPELVEQNVLTQLGNLRTHPAVATRLAAGDLQVHGWTYTIETGEVRVYDASASAFRPARETLEELDQRSSTRVD